MRRFAAALAIVAGVAAGGLPATAAHAATAPRVVWASSTGDVAQVQVWAIAEAGVADLKIRVVSPATNQEVSVLDSFHLSRGTEQDGWWVADERLLLPELGSYRLDAEITDRDGVHVAQRAVGWLWYAVKMFFKDVKVTKSVSYTKRELTVSGRLMGRWPGTDDVKPIEDFPLELVPFYSDFVDGFSGKVGHFELTTRIQQADEGMYLTTLWDDSRPFYFQAFADIPAPEVSQAETRITAAVDRDVIRIGEQVTLSGVVTWKTPTTWQPMIHVPVHIWYCDVYEYCTMLANGVSDDQGRYEIPATPYVTGTIRVSTYNPDPYLTTLTHADVDLTVLQLAQFTDFSGRREYDGSVALWGHLQFDRYWPFEVPVEIQFSNDGIAGWHKVSTLDISDNPTNPEGIWFEALLDEPGPGYWRARYEGESSFFQDAMTAPVFVP